MLRRVSHQNHLRGFTLVEVVLVLAILGTLAVLFVPVLGRSVPLAAALTSQTSATSAIDAVNQAHLAVGLADGPACTGAVAGVGSDPANTPAFANPCALAGLSSAVRFTALDAPSTDASTASVGALTTTAGTVVAVSVAQIPNAHATPEACHTIVRSVPGGAETYLTYPVPAAGCTAQVALTAPTSSCVPPAGDSWLRECALPRP